MTKPKAKAEVKAPEPVKAAEVKKPYVAPKVEKMEAKAEPVKAGKGFKAINSSTVCQLCRRADRTFGITV
jgi:hypothetical protein